MAYTTLKFEVRGTTGLLTLNRPAARNALNDAMRGELADLLAAIRDNCDLRALVMTGAGGCFCAGGDLRAMAVATRSEAENKARIEALQAWLGILLDLDIPVIAAVDGPAFGAGMNLALAADFILADESASFSQVFARVGLIPDLGGLYLLPRRIGLQKARDLVFTARTIDAAEAQALGIVDTLVPGAGLLDAALAMAGKFAAASPTALGAAKTILNRSLDLDRAALFALEAEAQARCIASQDHKDATAAFLAKQKPKFQW